MAKKIFIGMLLFLLSVTIFSTVDAKKSDGAWRLDGSASADIPRSFRLMTDDWHVDFHGKEPTRQDLADLHISASAQPSQAALSTIYEKLHELEPDAKIFMVDLRQESHGYANSLPVSWHTKHNAANDGKTTAQVEKIEREQLSSLRGIETTFTPMGKTDTKLLKPMMITPHVLLTEREASEKVGFTYARFAAADMQFPAPDVVDEFLTFVANLPDNAWLHFHCHAGHGRTTTFIVMYEIMRNPELSLEDICKRQYLLGGTNILLEPEGNDWGAKKTRDRAKKIRLFYDYMHSLQAKEISQSWSEWLAARNVK